MLRNISWDSMVSGYRNSFDTKFVLKNCAEIPNQRVFMILSHSSEFPTPTCSRNE